MARSATGRTTAPPKELIERVGRLVRQTGAQSVIISQVVAARFGLNTTDLECLDLINLRGQASAGELAQATGLTSGAVTALIDRLSEAGYVTRVADPEDRRRVQVRIRPAAIAPIAAVYLPLQERMFKLWSSYSADQLAVIADFLARNSDVAAACVEEIRHAPAKKRKRRAHGDVRP